MSRRQNLVVGCFALAAVGVGCYLLRPALGFLVVGALVWIDLTIESLKR